MKLNISCSKREREREGTTRSYCKTIRHIWPHQTPQTHLAADGAGDVSWFLRPEVDKETDEDAPAICTSP